MQENTNSHDPECDDAHCSCRTAPKKFLAAAPGSLARRDFLKLLGLSGAGSLVGGSVFLTSRQLMAADFSYSLIPANKNLDPAWVASLTARGTPTVVTSPAALANIGMPVGGICCGQLYLRGDGKLWFWDIFNAPTSAITSKINTAGNYDNPYDSGAPPVSQGFAVKVGSSYFSLDATGFVNVTFTGQYPIGVVNYSDPSCPVSVQLQAFSPFIPLDADNSGIPATVMEFTLTNTSGSTVSAEIAGWLQNAVCSFSNVTGGSLLNHAVLASDHTAIVSSLQESNDLPFGQVLYDDLERTTYAPWVATDLAGNPSNTTAFGAGPVDTTNYPSSSYQTLAGFHGRYVVNSHASAPAPDGTWQERDDATGKLTSPTFTLNYNYIYFLICGGNYPGQTCFNLCRASDNTVLISSTGASSDTYAEQVWNVSAWVGQQVYFQVVDSASGVGFGHIGVDYIRFANALVTDIVFEDFERTTYAPWVATDLAGNPSNTTAFGAGPVDTTNYPTSSIQNLSGFHGRYVVNSFASSPSGDSATGKLTSPTFTISRQFINFLICGGNWPGLTCMNLIVNGQVVRSSSGLNSNTYTQVSWDVSAWEGQTAYLQIVDNSTGASGWGNIGIDYIVFSNTARADVVFDDFERTTYAPWVADGTAFGSGPVDTTNYPTSSIQNLSGFHGRYVVNSFASSPSGDSAIGTLTSPTFTISRHFINFLICGGQNSGQTCMNLIVNGQVVRSATGNNSNTYIQAGFDVRAWEGQTAYLQIVDSATASWGNIGIDYIVFTDTPIGGWISPASAPDYGTMSLSLLSPQAGDQVSTNADTSTLASLFTSLVANQSTDAQLPLGSQLMGALGRPLTLAPGASATVTFVISWHFPKLDSSVNFVQNYATLQKYYSTLFADASAVAGYVAANYSTLGANTQLWRDTWYDSTLPYWFIDRTFANTSTLATMTSYRFSNGRFYGPEGMYCCPGTCGHVWGYGQAMGRIFPALEKYLRQYVDLGIGFNPSTGQIQVRAEAGNPAVDGQAMIILRAYRDHQMSVDSTFLTTNWPKIKLAMQWLISLDTDSNGILQGGQPNTLDATWYGKIPWLSSLYIAACKACQQMATEMGDTAFASQVGALAQAGATFIKNNLFYNSSYMVQIPDDSNQNVGANKGCEIDQVFGQSWAFQVGLGRVLDQTTTLSALAHLWTYNFAPDAGGFRTNPSNPIAGGRSFADVGEAGLVMGTFPDPANPLPTGNNVASSYFNECMSGFEHEVASHMIWEGKLQEGLAITRAIHDRYAAAKRNPYNEVECSDHYARAMASYGAFIAICGYEYHGPKGYLAFSPKITPENFQAAFTSAAGWGSFSQQRTTTQQTHTITLKQGQLTLNTLAFDLAPAGQSTGLMVKLNGSPVSASMSQSGVRVTVTLGSAVTIPTGQSLVVQISGTNLQDPARVFTINQVVPVTNGIQLAWNSVPGRTYTVQYTSSLPTASWTTLQTGVPASTGVSTTFADTTASGAAHRYYRVLLEPQ